jgi:hypothetical protein
MAFERQPKNINEFWTRMYIQYVIARALYSLIDPKIFSAS